MDIYLGMWTFELPILISDMCFIDICLANCYMDVWMILCWQSNKLVKHSFIYVTFEMPTLMIGWK